MKHDFTPARPREPRLAAVDDQRARCQETLREMEKLEVQLFGLAGLFREQREKLVRQVGIDWPGEQEGGHE